MPGGGPREIAKGARMWQDLAGSAAWGTPLRPPGSSMVTYYPTQGFAAP